MRTENSIKNSITSIISNIVVMLAGFISQAIFVRLLGSEYLGLNGLFTNILTMLSFFELGIGSAIVYHLYKPIANNDINKINALMNFYKKAYRIIAGIVFSIGLCIIPFLKSIVGEITIDININIIYIMFLINTASSYLLSYKRNLLQANQKNYIINIVHIVYVFVLNITQLTILFITKNYYLYLGTKFVCQILENIVDSIIATKLYPYLNEKCNEKLDNNTLDDIKIKVKSLIFHKVGSTIVLGTDNIIISYFLGVACVGMYSNYYTVIAAVQMLFGQVISSLTASIGNLLVSQKTIDEKYNTFNKIRFLNFILSCFSSICILLIITPFVEIWVGKQYILSLFVTIVLVLNNFQKMQRSAYNAFKDSAGIWHEDRFVPLVESVLNIVFSIVLLKIFGLAGVFMGTIVSGLALWCYSYPKYVYKNLFNRSYKDYAKETLEYIMLFVVLASSTYYIATLVTFNNIWLQLISNGIIAVLFPNIVLFIIFRKTDNFKYFVNLTKNIINKIIKRKDNETT